MTPEPATHLTAVPPIPGAPVADVPGSVAPPQTGGGAARFLTDVIVELGLVDRPRVEQAIEAARATGTTPEQVMLDQGTLSLENLARAIAERHGLDHLDLTVFHVDMSAANL